MLSTSAYQRRALTASLQPSLTGKLLTLRMLLLRIPIPNLRWTIAVLNSLIPTRISSPSIVQQRPLPTTSLAQQKRTMTGNQVMVQQLLRSMKAIIGRQRAGSGRTTWPTITSVLLVILKTVLKQVLQSAKTQQMVITSLLSLVPFLTLTIRTMFGVLPSTQQHLISWLILQLTVLIMPAVPLIRFLKPSVLQPAPSTCCCSTWPVRLR